MSTAYKEATAKSENKDWKIAEPKDDCERGNWWEIFNDAQLNELIEQLNENNQSIINAEANYRQALAIVEEARASYYPTLGFIGSGIRQGRTASGGSSGSSLFATSSTSSTSTGGSISGSTGASPLVSDVTSLALNASWEPDIWGLVRRTVEGDVAAAQASAALLATTRLSSQSSLAQYYFELRGLDTDQKLLDDTVKDYKKILVFTQNQYNSGVAAESDILQARSLLETAQAAAINNKILRAQYEHAIAVLIGIPPAGLTISFEPLGMIVPPVIPLEVPSMLLERRPDVAQAEREMAQANAQIGVAIAAYYPTLTLSANQAFTGVTEILKLFSKAAESWSIGAQVNETIFDGGLRSATVRAARAAYDASVANYRQTVLTALQSVEDNLVSLRVLDEQSSVLTSAANDARKALNIILNQYASGTVAYNSVLTAQINAYTAEKNAADVNYLRMTSAVGLIKSLGGGWSANDLVGVADNSFRK
jgi:NodT family efflux transporter outer membrane factor (OMF) lipoprotein